MNLFNDQIMALIDSACDQIDALPLEQKIEMLNQVRRRLHEVSPFKDEPIDLVEWVPGDTVEPNDYNPNNVASPEMKLLKRSILKDHYTQPIVTYPLSQVIIKMLAEGMTLSEIAKVLKEPLEKVEKFSSMTDGREVIDGEHRSIVGKGYSPIRDRLNGYLPVTQTDGKDRIASTIRHNRARGIHGVIPMTDIVSILIRRGWSDDEVAEELGMDADEVLRFKHNSGLPELFVDGEYSQSWK